MKSASKDFKHQLAGKTLEIDHIKILQIIFDDEIDPILRPIPKKTFTSLFRKAEQKRPLSKALKKLKALGLTAPQIDKVHECLNNAIALTAKKHAPDNDARIDYSDKYFLGQRINKRDITDEFETDAKLIFAEYLGNALGWPKYVEHSANILTSEQMESGERIELSIRPPA